MKYSTNNSSYYNRSLSSTHRLITDHDLPINLSSVNFRTPRTNVPRSPSNSIKSRPNRPSTDSARLYRSIPNESSDTASRHEARAYIYIYTCAAMRRLSVPVTNFLTLYLSLPHTFYACLTYGSSPSRNCFLVSTRPWLRCVPRQWNSTAPP